MDTISTDPRSGEERETASVARLTPRDRLALVLYIGVAVALGFVDFRVRPGNQQAYAVTDYIPGVLKGTYGAPATYRVLAPFLIDLFTRVIGADPLVGFVVTRLVFAYGALVALHAYARHWFGPGAAIGGTLGVAALLPLTFTNGWANPDSFPELLLFTLGCLLIARRNDLLFLFVLILATLNRETAAFLVLLWGCYRLPEGRARKDLARVAAYGFTWLAIYAGLRWLRGFQSYDYFMFWQNLDAFKPVPPGFDPYRRVFGYFWLVLLIVPGWLAVRAGRMPGVPTFMKRCVPVAAAVIVVCFMISKVIEARIFVPMFPLLLPGVLWVFAQPDHRAASSPART
jgi:hypothetical protein